MGDHITTENPEDLFREKCTNRDWEATGEWRVDYAFDSNWDTSRPVVIDPEGKFHTAYSPDTMGRGMAEEDAYFKNTGIDPADPANWS